MTDEAKKIVEALRHLGTPVDIAMADCSSCPMQDYPHTMEDECSENCPGVLMLMAADLIEELVSQLEEERATHQFTAECAVQLVDDLNESLDRESGLHIMLTSAQSAAETWERKYKEVLSKLETTTRERDAAERDITPSCVYCKHSYLNRPGIGNCEYADVFECVGNARFEWRGPCAENGGDNR